MLNLDMDLDLKYEMAADHAISFAFSQICLYSNGLDAIGSDSSEFFGPETKTTTTTAKSMQQVVVVII